MTLINMREIVQTVFPDKGETEINLLLNNAYKDFCHESGIYRLSEDISIVGGAITYPLASCATKAIDEVLSIVCKGTNGEPLANAPRFRIDAGNLVFYSYSDEVLTTLPTDVTYVNITYKAIPTALTNADEPVFDVAYHEALTVKVMQQLSARIKDLQSALYYSHEYDKMLMRATKRANMRQNKTTSNIQPYYY